MDADAWVFLGGTVTTVGAVLVAHINATRRQDAVEGKVDETMALSRPTGNGFAQCVRESLSRLEHTQAALAADVASLKGQVADQAVAHARLEGKLDGHLVNLGISAAVGTRPDPGPVVDS